MRARDSFFVLEGVAFQGNFFDRPMLEGVACPGFVFRARGNCVIGKLLRWNRVRGAHVPGIPFFVLQGVEFQGNYFDGPILEGLACPGFVFDAQAAFEGNNV